MTLTGLKVRSKSEVIIADLLDLNKIPFRYEEKLVLGGQIFYPDFTIMKPKDGEIIYWEHFGMTSQTEYRQTMIRKQEDYIRLGLLPWDNFIATYDNENGSINVLKIKSIIDSFILN